MPEFIDQEVRDLQGSESDERVTLLIGYDGDRDELTTALTELDGDVEDHLGRTTVKAQLPKSKIDAVCDLSGVLSVELDEADVTQLNQGNFEHRTDSIM
jgi:hypothetical protein